MNIEQQKTIKFGLELREEELIEEIRKIESSEKPEVVFKRDKLQEELDGIRDSLAKPSDTNPQTEDSKDE